jgi:hypothetical protein
MQNRGTLEEVGNSINVIGSINDNRCRRFEAHVQNLLNLNPAALEKYFDKKRMFVCLFVCLFV